MTIHEVKKICEEHHQNKAIPFKDGCQKCEFWKNQTGCFFYNRPIDWKLKEQNK